LSFRHKRFKRRASGTRDSGDNEALFEGDKMSTLLMKFLLAVYFVIFLASLFEKNFPRALYWLSAFGITVSVMWMK